VGRVASFFIFPLCIDMTIHPTALPTIDQPSIAANRKPPTARALRHRGQGRRLWAGSAAGHQPPLQRKPAPMPTRSWPACGIAMAAAISN